MFSRYRRRPPAAWAGDPLRLRWVHARLRSSLGKRVALVEPRQVPLVQGPADVCAFRPEGQRRPGARTVRVACGSGGRGPSGHVSASLRPSIVDFSTTRRLIAPLGADMT